MMLAVLDLDVRPSWISAVHIQRQGSGKNSKYYPWSIAYRVPYLCQVKQATGKSTREKHKKRPN